MVASIVVELIFLIGCVHSWGSEEMQMFDLIEEVKINFYDFMGVDHTSSISEIKRAYRRLSVKLHPDKNSNDPTAEAKFRQLVGIYEVLKDEELRKMYDEVLVNGLPDWKMPVFYYRKLRKMSNVELSLLFALLITAVHWAVLWGSYVEKRLIMDYKLGKEYKRHKARDRKLEQIDREINEKLGLIPRPSWKDVLPLAICKWTYKFCLFLPVLFGFIKQQAEEKLQEHRRLQEEMMALEDKEKQKIDKKNKRRRVVQENEVEIEAARSSLNAILSDIPNVTETEFETSTAGENQTKTSEWSESEVGELIRAVARYPGGIPGRWELIAKSLNRTVSDVTIKAKSLKDFKFKPSPKPDYSDQIPTFEVNENDVCGESSNEDNDDDDDDKDASENHADDFEMITYDESGTEKTTFVNPSKLTKSTKVRLTSTLAKQQQQQQQEPEIGIEATDLEIGETIDDQPYLSRKKLKEQKAAMAKESHKKSETSNLAESGNWTQVEQKQLEVAIRSIPKGTPERWDRIADCVPTKTKAEIISRVKILFANIKSKTQNI